MKHMLLLLLAATSIVSLQASELALVIAPRAEDGTVFKLGNVYSGREKGGFYRPEMLRYYISGITLHLSNGNNIAFPDSYILVDIRDVQRFPLGTADVSAGIDSITFHIGVDKARNHLDPTTYPDWHPLALKNPSMHWGWSAGYRFVTYEGNAGTSAGGLNAPFQIHTLDDKLYTSCTVSLGGMVTSDIPLVAYYERLLNNINVSRGVINHGSEDEAMILMQNLGARGASSAIYTAAVPTSVDDKREDMLVHPNPAQDVVSFPAGVVEVQFFDNHGSCVQTTLLGTMTNLVSVSGLAQGPYHVVVRYENGSLQHSALSIVR